MARDRRAACRSRRNSRRVADGSANLSRHTFAPSQEERRVAEATARGRLSRLQLARRRLATGVAGRQSRSLADRDHASKQGRHPRRGRLRESLRQRSSKHFLPHRLRSQNPEIRGTLTNPRHRALSGRQKPRNPAVLRFLLNHAGRDFIRQRVAGARGALRRAARDGAFDFDRDRDVRVSMRVSAPVAIAEPMEACDGKAMAA